MSGSVYEIANEDTTGNEFDDTGDDDCGDIDSDEEDSDETDETDVDGVEQLLFSINASSLSKIKLIFVCTEPINGVKASSLIAIGLLLRIFTISRLLLCTFWNAARILTTESLGLSRTMIRENTRRRQASFQHFSIFGERLTELNRFNFVAYSQPNLSVLPGFFSSRQFVFQLHSSLGNSNSSGGFDMTETSLVVHGVTGCLTHRPFTSFSISKTSAKSSITESSIPAVASSGFRGNSLIAFN